MPYKDRAQRLEYLRNYSKVRDPIIYQKNRLEILQKRKQNRQQNPIKFQNRDKKRILFKTTRLPTANIPRTGFCTLCPNNTYDNSCEKTQLHHFIYDCNDALAHTIEVCPGCHRKLHKRRSP